MGASTFVVRGKGKTAQEAFQAVVQHARWESGHGGYTGTIAEKHTFVRIPLPPGVKAEALVRQLMDEGDSRIDDKWGPAGCIEVEPGSFVFFGWASS